MPTFDFSKPLFFDAELQKKGVKAKSGLGSMTALNLGVDPAIKYKNLPFDCGNFPGDGTCCFNSMIGYPQKNGVALPIFDYETNIFNDLEAGLKYLAVKKSRGIGISEFFLRYMSWLGLSRNDIYKHTKFFVVCGPGETTAVDLIKRLKLMLSSLGILEDTEKTVARFLNVEIQAKPGSHVSTLRGYTDVKFILIDEASFWLGEEQNEIRSVAEGYIAKTSPVIAMVSTPSVPSTMFEKVMEEQNSLYKRYFLPYTIGLGKIYSEAEIELARLSPHFEREYNLKYGIGIGNIFTDEDIEAILTDSTEEYEPYKLRMFAVSIGCDPGFGSSMSSYVVTAQIGDKVVVLDAEAFERASFRTFANLIYDKYHQYHASRIFIDASARDVVDDLKIAMREETNYEYVMKQARHDYPFLDDAWQQRMIVCPIPFNKYNDKMMDGLYAHVTRRDIQIPRRFEPLIMDLRLARAKNGKLDKTGVNGFDLLDALRLACLMYKYE